MATSQEAQQEVLQTLHGHFERSADHLSTEQIAEMTALSLGDVQNALRVLHNKHLIEGFEAAEGQWPEPITGVTYP